MTFGDTDIFPRAFEYTAIQHDGAAVLGTLARTDVSVWNTRPHRTCLVPKGRYGFRVATQLDPLDFLVYTALVYEVGHDLEARRSPIADRRVFSFRFAPDHTGRMFNPAIGYSQFQEESKRLSAENGITHVAIADIADF